METKKKTKNYFLDFKCNPYPGDPIKFAWFKPYCFSKLDIPDEFECSTKFTKLIYLVYKNRKCEEIIFIKYLSNISLLWNVYACEDTFMVFKYSRKLMIKSIGYMSVTYSIYRTYNLSVNYTVGQMGWHPFFLAHIPLAKIDTC